MPQTQSSPKPINNHLSIDIANDDLFLIPESENQKGKKEEKNLSTELVNASFLFSPSFALFEENSRQGLRRSLTLTPEPVLAKNEPPARFLTPEPINTKSAPTTQKNNYFPKGNLFLSAQNQGYEKNQTTKATIGNGIIRVGGTQSFDNTTGNFTGTTGGTNINDIITNDPINPLANLNRNITKSQVMTKDTITGALDINTTIDLRLLDLTGKGQKEMAMEVKNFPKNVADISGDAFDLGIWAGLGVYDIFTSNDIADPKVKDEDKKALRKEIRDAAIKANSKGNKEGDMDTLRDKVKTLTGKTPTPRELKAIIELTNERNFGQLMDNIGMGSYSRFLDKYTLSVGVFFDGTNNKASRDAPKGEETNVFRMYGNYDSKEKIYVNGVGTSESNKMLNTLGQAGGYGVDKNQQTAQTELMNIFDKNQNVLFFPLDVVGFSRGATTAMDFVNKINNENYWNLGILTRSELLFDPVGSYGIAGNNNDLGRNFSVPTNIIAIQINAKDEVRHNFPLQSLSNPDGTLNGKYWKEITLPGVHSDIGGSYANGYQWKDQQIALYSMQTMVNEAGKYGINFKPTPVNQMPTMEFNYLMNSYRLENINYKLNPTINNLTKLNDIERIIRNSSVHDSTYAGTGELQNYSFGSRNIYYPNVPR